MFEIRQNQIMPELFSIVWNEDSKNRIVFSNRDSSFFTVKDHQDVAPPMDY